MPAYYAKREKPVTDTKLVLFVVYPDIVLLDLVGPLQVFSHAPDPKTGLNGYECAVASVAGKMVQTNTVVSIPSKSISSFLDKQIHTLIVVGGGGANQAMYDEALLNEIRTLTSGATRICSVCSGALVLAAAGLLNGRRAVTHWEDCKTLADEFPEVRVEMDPIYIKDGNVWTSAGITAGIDMALAVVAEDIGRNSALHMARSMVTHMFRAGGQSQFSPALSRQSFDDNSRFEKLHRWIEENPALEHKVEDLAERVNMSSRNFSRLYSKQMGMTPAKAVEAIRTEVARNLLETTELSVKRIAVESGFIDEERMRRAFKRQINVSPTEYRHGFQG